MSRATVKRAVAGALSVGLLGGLGLGIAPGAMAAGENITFIQGVKGDGFYMVQIGQGVLWVKSAEATKL